MTLTELCSKATDIPLMHGMEQSESYAEISERICIELAGGLLPRCSRGVDSGIGVRCFSTDGRKGFSWATGLRRDYVKRACMSAAMLARHSRPGTRFQLPPASSVPQMRGIYDEETAELQFAEDVLKRIERQFRKLHNVMISITARKTTKALCNSSGFEGEFSETTAAAYISIFYGSRSRGFGDPGYFQVQDEGRKLKEIDLEALVDKAFILKKKIASAKRIQPGEYKVLLDSDVVCSFVQSFVSRGTNISNIKRGNYVSEINPKQIATPLLSIRSDGTVEGGMDSCPFDGEGVSTRCVTIIDRGKLNACLNDLETAQQYGAEPTGSTKRESYNCQPLVSNCDIKLEQGNSLSSRLVREMVTGILLKKCDLLPDEKSGKIFSPVSLAYKIENGEIGDSLKGGFVLTDAAALLRGIVNISSDHESKPGWLMPRLEIDKIRIV